jgi:hypothetical protein
LPYHFGVGRQVVGGLKVEVRRVEALAKGVRSESVDHVCERYESVR